MITIRTITTDIINNTLENFRANLNAYLEIFGHTINDKDEVTETALMAAANKGDLDTVQLLIQQYKADVNIQDASGDTALMFAAGAGHTEVVRFLLKAQANPHLQNEGKQTALHWAVMSLHTCHTEIVELLLLNDTSSLNTIDSNGRTTLKSAAEDGHTPIVELLIYKGANAESVLKYSREEWQEDHPDGVALPLIYKMMEEANRFIPTMIANKPNADVNSHNTRIAAQAECCGTALGTMTPLLNQLSQIINSYLSLEPRFNQIATDCFTQARLLLTASPKRNVSMTTVIPKPIAKQPEKRSKMTTLADFFN